MLVVKIRLLIDGVEVKQRLIKSFTVKDSRIERPTTLNLSLVKRKDNKQDLKLYKIKNKIELLACYDKRYPFKKIFEGTIKKANKEQEDIILECEDYSYLLSEKMVNATFINMSDSDIIKRLAESIVNVDSVKKIKKYKKISFTNKSIRFIINTLANNALADYYFKGDRLFYGKKYEFAKQDDIYEIGLKDKYIVNNNLEGYGGVANLKVIIVSTDEQGKRHIGKAGKGTNIRKFRDYTAGKNQVQEEAEKRYKELSFKGYRGSVSLLAEPLLSHSNKVILIQDDEQRTAWIDSISYSFSLLGGLRQEWTIGEESKEKGKTKRKVRL